MQTQTQLALRLERARLRLAESALVEAVDRECGAPSALVRRFVAWHRAHPHVYRLIERFVAELRDRRVRRAGIKAIWERVRWEMAVETSSRSPRLNNNWTAYYARLLIIDHPEWGEMFATRRVGRVTPERGSDAPDSPGELKRGNRLGEPAGASGQVGGAR